MPHLNLGWVRDGVGFKVGARFGWGLVGVWLGMGWGWVEVGVGLWLELKISSFPIRFYNPSGWVAGSVGGWESEYIATLWTNPKVFPTGPSVAKKMSKLLFS